MRLKEGLLLKDFLCRTFCIKPNPMHSR